MTQGQAVTGGRVVARALVAAGVTHVFCVPGEGFLALLDALYDESRLTLVSARHEGGASFMAEAFAKLTHRPAVCLATHMVGGGNLAIGLHTARQDSSPVIALVGQVDTRVRYRDAFQEAELTDVFGGLVKWAVEPPRADRLGDLVLRAARVAVSGRPGPVLVALREDLLRDTVDAPDAFVLQPPRPAPDPATIAETCRLLRGAERPVLLLGRGVLAAEATALYVRLAEQEEIPVLAAWRRPDVFPNDHRLYLGQAGLGAVPSVVGLLESADVVLAVGTRLDQYTTDGYRLPRPQTYLIHADVGAEDLGGPHGRADVPCVADAGLFAEALLAALGKEEANDGRRAARRAQNTADREIWEAETTPTRGAARAGFVDQQAVAALLRERLTPNTITVTDAGNFAGWPARYLRWSQPGTFLGPTSGAMGYGVPAALAASLARPHQPVVGFVGDGGFLMTGAEIETAVRVGAAFALLVYDNAQYGTIRMHQMRDYPGRPIATTLGPIDAVKYAEALGGLGIAVRDEQEIGPALDEALAARRPAVLHLRIDPEQIAVTTDHGTGEETVALTHGPRDPEAAI